MDPEDEAVKMFQNEVLAVFLRWSEESDLTDMELLESAVALMNRFADDAVTFEPDPQAFSKDDEEEQ